MHQKPNRWQFASRVAAGLVVALLVACVSHSLAAHDKPTTWRVPLTVTTPLRQPNVPFDPHIDFAELIEEAGVEGVLDLNSIRIKNIATQQCVPYTLREDFADGDRGRLEWVIADPQHKRFEIQFQVVAGRRPRDPAAYTPPIGNGDLLRYNAAEPRPVALIYPSRLVDLNGDGKQDLAGCWNYAYRPGVPWDGFVYYPRVGDPEQFQFGDRTRIRFVSDDESAVLDPLPYLYMHGDFADFDGDGLVDLVFSPSKEQKLYIFLNVGRTDADGTVLFRRETIVERDTPDWWPCRVVDLDGDDRLDLMVGSTYLRNRSRQGWPMELEPGIALDAGRNPTFLDVDSDGRTDAVCLLESPSASAPSYRIGWRRNLGGDAFRFADAEPLEDVNAMSCNDVMAVRDAGRLGVLVEHDAWQSISFYELQRPVNGAPRFRHAGRAQSISAVMSLSDQAWPCLCDWDADGDLDMLVGGGFGWPRIVRNEGTAERPAFAEPELILSEGEPIRILRDDVLGGQHWHNMGYPYPEFVDWDADGRNDLVVPNETNRIFWYRNVGTAQQPKFGPRQPILCDGFPDSRESRRRSAELAADESVPNSPYPLEADRPFFWRTGAALADFNGDGFVDFVTHDGATRQATLFAQYRDDDGSLRLKKDRVLRLNDGRAITDAIVNRSASWTESFRCADWDGDGLFDLFYSLAGAHSGIQDNGSIYLLRNCGTRTSPEFEPPVTMRCFGEPIRITSHGPHPWVGDFDGDGGIDMVACVEWSVYPFYRHAALVMPQRPNFELGAVRSGEPAQPADRREPRVVFNDDAQMLSEAPLEGTSDFVKAWLDKEIKAVSFSTYVFLAATPDVCTFDTRVGETYGDRFGPGYSGGWAPGIRGLRAEGTDALRLVCEHMHAQGKEVLAAIRMSDTHHRSLSRDEPLCPQFALKNPQFVIKQPDGRTNETALDYSHHEVRAHRLSIMREIAEGYDVDGLELNFVRWAKHFPRDRGREKAPIMTKYIGRIREMLDAAAYKKKRERLTLGVRVPESLEACRLAGVDVEEWVRQGWIDYIVISTWNNTDPQLPVDEFTRFAKPAGVDTIVVMGNMIGSIYGGPPSVLDRPAAMSAKHQSEGYLGMLITESEARGAAANYYAWGADSISFWNVGIHFGGEATAAPEQQARIARWTQAVRSQESVFAGPRCYRYLPMGKGISSRKPPRRNYPWYEEGRSPLGHVNSPVLTFDPDHFGKRLIFPFRMADGRSGEQLQGRLTFWIYYLSENDKIVVDINGDRVDPARIKRTPAGERRGGLPGLRFDISLADCPPFCGDNELGLTLQSAVEGAPKPYMEELEVVVLDADGRKPIGHE